MSHLYFSLGHPPWVPAVIFLSTYLLIAIESSRGNHLDRTAAAFCGAVAMVLAGVISLDDSYKVIDWNTLIFLLGMMILVAHFQISGFFDWIALHLAGVARTRLQLLALLVFTSGILSAFFVNDTICLVLTPIVLIVTERLNIPPLPYLLAIASASNVGSVMSVTGNPQNALVGISAHISFLGFLGHLAPVAMVGLAITFLVLAVFFGKDLRHPPFTRQAPPAPVHLDRLLLAKCCVAAGLVIAFWIAGYSFPIVAISAGALILLAGRVKSQSVYQRVDWELLLFFASLFVVIHGFQASGSVDLLIARFHHAFEGSFGKQLVAVSGLMLILSNLVSNVPAVLLFKPLVPSFRDSHFIWLVVASASTLAGNATPLSSVANLIVLQQARRCVSISFWQFTRVGLVITALTTLASMGILAIEHRLFSGN